MSTCPGEHAGTHRCARAPNATGLQPAFEKRQRAGEGRRGTCFPGEDAAGWHLERSGGVSACAGGKFTGIPHPPTQQEATCSISTRPRKGWPASKRGWARHRRTKTASKLHSFLSEVCPIKISPWTRRSQEACERPPAESEGFHGRGMAEGEGVQTSAYREIQ